MNAVVLIPAYQAGKTIGPLVREVRALGLPVVVVDDASSDATAQRAQESGAQVIRRSANGGKGVALREGFSVIFRSGVDWIVTMDADGQHLASEIPLLLQETVRGRSDIVIGNRMEDPRGMPLERRLTNRTMSWLISRLAGQRVPDTQCGFRAISRRVLESVTLVSGHFEIESELVLRGARAGFRISSVPISSVYQQQMSFIRPLQDTLRFLKLLRSL